MDISEERQKINELREAGKKRFNDIMNKVERTSPIEDILSGKLGSYVNNLGR